MKRLLAGVAIATLVIGVGAVRVAAGPETIAVASTPGFAFAPPTIVVPHGTTLTVAQLDPIARHDLVSRATVKGKPMFGTPRSLAFGETMVVPRVEKLKPASYAFVCTLHDGMMGQLIVRAVP